METLINQYLDYLIVERNFSPRTVEAYEHDLGKFTGFLQANGRSDVLAVTQEDVSHFLSECADTNSAVTLTRKLFAIRSLFKYLLRKKLIVVNPTSEIEKMKLPQKQPAYLTESEYRNLIETVKREAAPYDRLRDIAIVLLLLGTGIRLSELVGLTLDRVSLEKTGRSIKVRGKGDKERTIPLMGEVVSVLETYLKHRPKVTSDHLFISRRGDTLHPRSVYGLVKKYLQKSDIQKTKAAVHSLRHTFGTSLMNNGVNIVVIQELLGHKKLETTRRYLHINNIDLRNAVDSLVLSKP